MGAAAGFPGLAVGGGPQANALTTTIAARHQIASEEFAELRVENDEGISIIRTMAAVKRARLNFGEGRPAIAGVGSTRIGRCAAVVGVVVDHYGLAFVRGAGRYHAFAATHVIGGVTIGSVAD